MIVFFSKIIIINHFFAACDLRTICDLNKIELSYANDFVFDFFNVIIYNKRKYFSNIVEDNSIELNEYFSMMNSIVNTEVQANEREYLLHDQELVVVQVNEIEVERIVVEFHCPTDLAVEHDGIREYLLIHCHRHFLDMLERQFETQV